MHDELEAKYRQAYENYKRGLEEKKDKGDLILLRRELSQATFDLLDFRISRINEEYHSSSLGSKIK